MQIQCRSCGRDVAAADVHLERLVAKCGHCDAVFSFTVPGSAPAADAATRPAARARPDLALPKGFVVEEQGRDLVIRRSWRSGCAIAFLLVFAGVWNGVCWTGFAMMSVAGAELFRWFLIPFLLIGGLLAYGVATLCVNATTIRAAQGLLAIRHGPLPVPGNVDLPASDIRQLFVERRISSSRGSSGSRSVRERFVLQARLLGGEKRKLIELTDSDPALWLEHAIEEHLGIPDRAERGEI